MLKVSLMYGTFILDSLSVLHNSSIGSMDSIMVVLCFTTVHGKNEIFCWQVLFSCGRHRSRWHVFTMEPELTKLFPYLGNSCKKLWKTDRRSRALILSCFRKKFYSRTKKIIFLDLMYNVHSILTIDILLL